MITVDVIIPSYKPGKSFLSLLRSLEKQTLRPEKIIIVNTEKRYYDDFVASVGVDPAAEFDNIEVVHIAKSEFDHGHTRNVGVSHSTSDLFLMMTQDAVPRDNQLIAALAKALEDGDAAAAYARQYPKSDCSLAERYSRKFNYPNTAMKKTQDDLGRLGIKTYFCSNVCAMYKREIFDQLGGFVDRAIFNEDMVYAGMACQAGFAIMYVPEAGVVHSHNYTCGQQFHRNFDLGVSQTDHPEIFGSVKSESEGKKMVRETIAHFRRIGKAYMIPYYVCQCAARFLGYKLGRKYRSLPAGFVRACSLNKEYWDRH